MDLLHVSFEVRIKLKSEAGDCAMLVRGNELQRTGNRMLIPIGGGIQATEKDLQSFGGILTELSVKDDLRFTVTHDQLGYVHRLAKRMLPGRILREAWRELVEEVCEAHELLDVQDLVGSSLLHLGNRMFTGMSVRHSTWGEATFYLVGVVKVKLQPPALRKLVKASQPPKSMIEFVLPELLEKGNVSTSKNSFIPPIYEYLGPQ